MSPSPTNVARLKRYAEARGLILRVIDGDQYDPHLVVLRDGPTGILSRTSDDSTEAAASYLINALERLGVEVPRR